MRKSRKIGAVMVVALALMMAGVLMAPGFAFAEEAVAAAESPQPGDETAVTPLAAQCVVYFDCNGGQGGGVWVCDVGTQLGVLPTATRAGYDFAGWWTAAEGGTPVTEQTLVPVGAYDAQQGRNTVFYYAHWTPSASEHEVRFLIDNDETAWYNRGKTAVSHNQVIGEIFTPADIGYSRSGYTFAGWWTAEVGGTQVLPTTRITEAMDLYAHWEAVVPKTVAFDAQGGSAVAGKTVNSGSTVGTLPATTRPGYTFDGWYTAVSGGTKITASTIVTGGDPSFLLTLCGGGVLYYQLGFSTDVFGC